MLAMCDKYGVIECSLPGLADAARVSREECVEALRVLMSPDPDSRTKDNEGRRIGEVEGGWRILNHAKYRDKMSPEHRLEYQAKWQREYRAKKKATKPKRKSPLPPMDGGLVARVSAELGDDKADKLAAHMEWEREDIRREMNGDSLP